MTETVCRGCGSDWDLQRHSLWCSECLDPDVAHWVHELTGRDVVSATSLKSAVTAFLDRVDEGEVVSLLHPERCLLDAVAGLRDDLDGYQGFTKAWFDGHGKAHHRWEIISLGGHRRPLGVNSALAPRTFEQRQDAALRRAIGPTMATFANDIRDRGVVVVCERCQSFLDPVDDFHVDHLDPWPFRRIVDLFIVEHGPVPTLNDNGTACADPGDEDTFRAFHDARAVLGVSHPTCNMGNGGRRG